VNRERFQPGNSACRECERNNARWNSTRKPPLMPHRPLFVSRCHHFSPVIYFIAVLPLPLPPHTPRTHTRAHRHATDTSFLLRRLRFLSLSLSPPPTGFPHLPPAPSHPSRAPRLQTPSRSKLSAHHTTQHNSTLLTLPGTLLYVSISVPFSFSLSVTLSRPRGARSRLLPRSHQHFDDDAGREEERERERERERETTG